MRVRVTPKPRATSLVEVKGTPQPSAALAAGPAALRELVALHGEGLLFGQLWLFSQGPRQVDAELQLRALLDATANSTAWLPLRRVATASYRLVGVFTGGYGWLVWDELTQSLRLFSTAGTWLEVGPDLPALLAFLRRHDVMRPLVGFTEHHADELARRVIPETYVASRSLPHAEFSHALATQTDVQPSFAALMDSLPWPDALWAARQALRERPSTEWAERIDRNVARSTLCRMLHERLNSRPRDDLLDFRALGFEGTTRLDDAALVSPPWVRTPEVLAALMRRHVWPAVLTERLRLVAPIEAAVSLPADESFSRLWPLALLLGDANVVRPLADPDFLVCLDAWLARVNELETAMRLARVRVQSAPVTEAQRREWVAASSDDRLGTWALLLTQAREPGVIELFQELARREKGPESSAAALVLLAAEARGKSAGTLELLRILASRARAFGLHDRIHAARLAASWGDAEARDLAERLRATLARRAREM